MTTIQRSVDLAATPDEVWAVVGEFGGIQEWHPQVSAPELRGADAPNGAGTERVFGAGTEGEMFERLLHRDEAARRLVYTMPEPPFPISGHEAAIAVRQREGGGSVVDWVARFVPDAQSDVPGLEAQLGDGVFRPGLDALAERFGSAN